jgi:DNA-binding transcriptional MerR regulator
MTDSEPLFNLKAVVQQTGLKPDTLRAWERRYGLPSPARSGGRHRLYTLSDLEVLRWLMARQREGLSISRAVDLWRQMQAGGRGTLPIPRPPGSAAEPSLAGGMLDQLRQEWLAACLAYDERRAEQAAAQAFALYSPETVCLELLQRAIAEVGDLWQQGAATVQQEHFASELAIRQVESLLMAAPPATRPGQILAACPPQEYHVFGLLLLTLLLRRRGWAVVHLGECAGGTAGCYGRRCPAEPGDPGRAAAALSCNPARDGPGAAGACARRLWRRGVQSIAGHPIPDSRPFPG